MKKYVDYKTPTNTWLSLDDYQHPVWRTDLWEVENVIVKNVDEYESGWEKVEVLLPCCCTKDREVVRGASPWQFEDRNEDMVDITHFMIVEGD